MARPHAPEWRRRLLGSACLAAALAAAPAAKAAWPGVPTLEAARAEPAADAGQLCRAAVKAAETGSDLPPNLLMAIAMTESGRRAPHGGRVSPWPWSINVEGEDHVFDSKADAIAYVRAAQARGVRSIDVGCMQINLMHHPDAFASLEQAFDPRANAAYAVTFLDDLRRRTGDWGAATAAYHSATPELGGPYRDKVEIARAEAARAPDAGRMPVALNGFLAVAAPALFAAPPPSLPSASLPPRSMVGGGMAGGAGLGLFAPRAPLAGRGGLAMRVAMLAAPAGGGGHGLEFYRAAPVALASRPVLRLAAP